MQDDCLAYKKIVAEFDKLPKVHRIIYADACQSGSPLSFFADERTKFLSIGGIGQNVACQTYSPLFLTAPDTNEDGIVTLGERMQYARQQGNLETQLQYYSTEEDSNLIGETASQSPFVPLIAQIRNKSLPKEVSADVGLTGNADYPVIEVHSLEAFEWFRKQLKDEQLALVTFSAYWCGPCHEYAPIFEKLAQDYRGQFLMLRVKELEGNQLDFSPYKVTGIPNVSFVDAKRVVQVDDRLQPRNSLVNFYAENFMTLNWDKYLLLQQEQKDIVPNIVEDLKKIIDEVQRTKKTPHLVESLQNAPEALRKSISRAVRRVLFVENNEDRLIDILIILINIKNVPWLHEELLTTYIALRDGRVFSRGYGEALVLEAALVRKVDQKNLIPLDAVFESIGALRKSASEQLLALEYLMQYQPNELAKHLPFLMQWFDEELEKPIKQRDIRILFAIIVTIKRLGSYAANIVPWLYMQYLKPDFVLSDTDSVAFSNDLSMLRSHLGGAILLAQGLEKDKDATEKVEQEYSDMFYGTTFGRFVLRTGLQQESTVWNHLSVAANAEFHPLLSSWFGLRLDADFSSDKNNARLGAVLYPKRLFSLLQDELVGDLISGYVATDLGVENKKAQLAAAVGLEYYFFKSDFGLGVELGFSDVTKMTKWISWEKSLLFSYRY